MNPLDRLLGFNYLQRRRLLTLAVLLTVASTLFSVTAYSLLGFYHGFNAYLGEGDDVVALYDRASRTPFTGLVPRYLADRLSALPGVLASSPEALGPCRIGEAALFIRGIIPDAFMQLNPLPLLDGAMITLDDVNAILVGQRLANRLHLQPQDRVLVHGVLADQYLEVYVKGIYETHSFLDDEALAPLYVGQWLRTDYGHVTLIRFKIDPSVVSPAAIFDAVATEATDPSHYPPDDGQKPSDTSILPDVVSGFRLENMGVDAAQRFMRSYLDRYGVSQEVILILALLIFLFASISIPAAATTIITQHQAELHVLRSIGAPTHLVKRDLVLKLLPWSLLAAVIGVALAAAVLTVSQAWGYFQVLSYTASFQFDLLITALNLLVVTVLVALSVLTARLH